MHQILVTKKIRPEFHWKSCKGVLAQYQDVVLKGMELRLHASNSLRYKLVLTVIRPFLFHMFLKQSHQSGRKRVLVESELDEVGTTDKLLVYEISSNMSSRIHGKTSCAIFRLYILSRECKPISETF